MKNLLTISTALIVASSATTLPALAQYPPEAKPGTTAIKFKEYTSVNSPNYLESEIILSAIPNDTVHQLGKNYCPAIKQIYRSIEDNGNGYLAINLKPKDLNLQEQMSNEDLANVLIAVSKSCW